MSPPPAARRWRPLAATLRREGLTAIQTAKALGISRAAADKLVTRAAADTPTTGPTALTGGGHLLEEEQNLQDVTARVEEVQREVGQATVHHEEFSARGRRLA